MNTGAGAQAALEAATLLEHGLWLGVGLVALFFAFRLLRTLLHRLGGGTREARTWDCGCQIGSPRIQYSAASFVEPLTRLFAAVVGLRRHHAQTGEIFPLRLQCEFRLSGGLLRGIFAPFFEGVRQSCDSLKVLQHGHIHIYILYILVVIAGLLLWGLPL
jgi:hydrogenase-4 component B